MWYIFVSSYLLRLTAALFLEEHHYMPRSTFLVLALSCALSYAAYGQQPGSNQPPARPAERSAISTDPSVRHEPDPDRRAEPAHHPGGLACLRSADRRLLQAEPQEVRRSYAAAHHGSANHRKWRQA